MVVTKIALSRLSRRRIVNISVDQMTHTFWKFLGPHSMSEGICLTAKLHTLKSYKSIGKFCSKNLIDYSLFTMYSYDGYAKLKFHSSDSGNNGFSAQYRLRSSTLSGFGDCSSQYLYMDSDNFYTSGWPENYEKDGTCTFEISARGTKKLIFMDLDLRKAPIFGCSRYTSDYIEIRGAESSSVGYDSATVLKGPICGTSNVVTYTTSQNTVYVKLKRYDYSSNKRGIVAGYLTYNEGQDSSQAFVITAIISVTVGLILIISIASVIACCICKHNRKKQQERQHIFATAGETVGYGNVCHVEPHGYMGAPAYTNSEMPPPYTEAVSTPYQQAPTHVDSQLPPEVNPAMTHLSDCICSLNLGHVIIWLNIFFFIRKIFLQFITGFLNNNKMRLSFRGCIAVFNQGIVLRRVGNPTCLSLINDAGIELSSTFVVIP
ncbi:uncharacterized protein LOC135694999 isoform X2 [Rhopilema esculentum]|uniref:uncharacterized protein LOC135694999 isoform X2 n=1 Tax=Rhopilema esculentum TaxID=499914 RepID=UPI0031D4E231